MELWVICPSESSKNIDNKHIFLLLGKTHWTRCSISNVTQHPEYEAISRIWYNIPNEKSLVIDLIAHVVPPLWWVYILDIVPGRWGFHIYIVWSKFLHLDYCITGNICVQENFANFARFAKFSCTQILSARASFTPEFAKFSCRKIA